MPRRSQSSRKASAKGWSCGRGAQFGPVELFAYGPDDGQQGAEVAVVLRERLQLGDHDRGRRLDRDPDAQQLRLLRTGQQRFRGDRYAGQPVQHIDQRELTVIRGLAVVAGRP